MTMSSKEPKVWLATLDTKSPHIYLGQVKLQVGRVGYWGGLPKKRNSRNPRNPRYPATIMKSTV